MMGKRDWASITRHKTNGAVVYIMIAGGCVSTWTKTPSGETITSHTNTRDESIDSLLMSVCGECQDMLKSQWGFTSSIQVLRNNYPNSYAELAKEMERKLEEQGDEQ
jgi:L-lactate utilization protein LutB